MTDLTLDSALDGIAASAEHFSMGLDHMPEVKEAYARKTGEVSACIRAAVTKGEISPAKATSVAEGLGREILNLARARDRDQNRELAGYLTRAGAPFDKAITVAMGNLGLSDRSFHSLSDTERQRVFVEVIEPSKPIQSIASGAIQRMQSAGGGLWVATVVFAAYSLSATANFTGDCGLDTVPLRS